MTDLMLSKLSVFPVIVFMHLYASLSDSVQHCLSLCHIFMDWSLLVSSFLPASHCTSTHLFEMVYLSTAGTIPYQNCGHCLGLIHHSTILALLDLLCSLLSALIHLCSSVLFLILSCQISCFLDAV